MALSTRVATGTSCHSCRQWVLRSFIASIGGSFQPPKPLPQRRAFSTPPSRLWREHGRLQNEFKMNEHKPDETKISYSPSFASEDANSLPDETGSETNVSPKAPVPWYLQVEPQMQPQENAVSAQQSIPELPESSPDILRPLLERVSIELGMDDLSLMDLRGIDPPPALGANLLMIIGTARSEKHLHFSADKLCRWLRTEYKLTPYADGLLGRQELKLKMRRQAKRSRLLSAVGAKSTGDTELEDGIRTGWICINLGTVEGGELPKTQEQLEREKNIVGFGTTTKGSNVVVQLLTEEKRGEMDLEKLWTTILRASKRERDALEEQDNTVVSEATPSSGPYSAKADHGASNGTNSGTSYNTPLNNISNSQHVRAFHTSARREQFTQVSDKSKPLERLMSDSSAGLSIPDSVIETLERLSSVPTLKALGEMFPGLLASTKFDTSTEDSKEGLPDSTPMISAFYDAVPHFPNPAHWHAHIRLLCLASRAGHPNCGLDVITKALADIQVAGLVPLEETYLTVLRAMLNSVPSGQGYTSRVEQVFDLLEEMECHGYNALRQDTLELLHRTLVGPISDTSPMTVQSLVPALGTARLRRLLTTNDVAGFWRTWSSYPRRLLTRSVGMYVVLFDAIAENKLSMGAREAGEVISRYVEDMEREQPPVVLEKESLELSMSIFKALRFADPENEDSAWDEVRTRCEAAARNALQR